jgi:tetratricopeptide (TPR) repeat protein
MKKANKGKVRRPRQKKLSRQQPACASKSRAAARDSAVDLYSGGFDFALAQPPPVDATVLNRARSALRDGKPGDAMALAKELLVKCPNDDEALNVAGVAAFQSGDAASALDLLQTAVAFAPKNAEAWTNLGNVLAALKKGAEAESAYTKAIDADPAHADAPFNLGVLVEAVGRSAEALDAFDRTLEISPGHAGALQGRANALKSRKRLEQARSAYETALTRNPSLAEARTNLAAVLQELGDFAGAAREARRAFEVDPDLLEAEYNYAIALQELGRYEEAIEAYRDVLHHAPEFAPAALNIGYGLQQLGRLDEAAEAFEKAIGIDPDFAKAHVNLADLRLQQGDPQSALDVCGRFLASHPGQTDLLAFKAVALKDLGKDDEVRLLNDFERFVRPVKITPPDGYANLEDFNEALCRHVLEHPTLTFSPQSHATRKGKHSGELLSEPKGPIAGLESEILRLASAYRENLGNDESHPFIAKRPTDWTLSVWGVVMQAAGHQIPHIHPSAWLSGVYYPKLPDIVAARSGDKAGWIEFARPPEHFHNRAEPEVYSVQPELGLMVLFPSYFYHHTVPFEAEGTRISIAFDLMPA